MIKTFTFRDKKTNDLKQINVNLEEGDSKEVIERNMREFERVSDKLEKFGWVNFPEGFSSYKDWN